MNNTSNSSKAQVPRREMTWQEFVAALATLFVGLSSFHFYKNKNYYYQEYFIQIHYIPYILLSVLSALALYQIIKRTKPLRDRRKYLRIATNPSEGIFAGVTDEDQIKLHVPWETRTGHVQIIGSTGRGKTESVIIPWLLRDVLRGRNAILIDGKGDPAIARRIQEVTKYFPKPVEAEVFNLGDLANSCVTNPLACGTPQQITDRIFAAFEFSDPYYKAVQYDIVMNVIELLVEVEPYQPGGNPSERGLAVPGTVTFKRIYEVLTSDDALSAALEKSYFDNKRLQRLLEESPKEREQKLSGILSQIAPFAVGEIATVVNGKAVDDPRPYCDVTDPLIGAYRFDDKQRLFIVLIPTLKYQVLGHQLGKLMLQQLGYAVGERAASQKYTDIAAIQEVPVFLDEFSAFVYKGFENILNKARSSNVAMHLSHQSLGDLSLVSPDFARIINANTNVKCLLGLNDPDTADFFARHLGTQTAEKATERAKGKNLFGESLRTGDYSLRDVEAYKIHPNELKNFTRGKGVLHMPGLHGNISEVIYFEPFHVADRDQREVS